MRSRTRAILALELFPHVKTIPFKYKEFLEADITLFTITCIHYQNLLYDKKIIKNKQGFR